MTRTDAAGAPGAQRRSRLRDAAFAALVCLLVFAGLEAALRLADRSGGAGDNWRPPDMFYLDAMWMPEPFSTPGSAGVSIARFPFNTQIRYEKAPPRKTVRIICMGGSVTQGFDHPVEFSYPIQLEAVLNEDYDYPVQFQVLNAGNLGGNSYSGLFFFDRLCRPYEPDVVTLMYTLNDLIPSSWAGLFVSDFRYVEMHRTIQRSPLMRWGRDVLQSLRLYRLIYRAILASSEYTSRNAAWNTPITSPFPPRTPPDVFRKSIEGFIDLGAKDGFETVLLSEGDIHADYGQEAFGPGQSYWAVLSTLARERGIVFLQPDRIFGDGPDNRKPYFFDYCHMTRPALRAYAERLAADLVDSGVIDRAVTRALARDAKRGARGEQTRRFRRVSSSGVADQKPVPGSADAPSDRNSTLVPEDTDSSEVWDEHGNLLSQSFDRDEDGEPDECYEYEYDDRGYRVLMLIDDDCDGLDACLRMERDDRGNVTRFQHDDGCDGDFERPGVCMENTYDAQGRITARRVDLGCDGTPSLCSTHSYDERGNMTGERIDRACDGTADSCVARKFDGIARPVARYTDEGCDGTVDECAFTTYYEDGDVTETTLRGENCTEEAP